MVRPSTCYPLLVNPSSGAALAAFLLFLVSVHAVASENVIDAVTVKSESLPVQYRRPSLAEAGRVLVHPSNGAGNVTDELVALLSPDGHKDA